MKKAIGPVCRWTEDHDGNWETGCEEMFLVNEGAPKENGMVFCCYCGKALKEVRHRDA